VVDQLETIGVLHVVIIGAVLDAGVGAGFAAFQSIT